MKCGKCGYVCNHVLYHRQPADKAYIECNKRKTKECDLLPIREVELKTIMEQVAGRRENVAPGTEPRSGIPMTSTER